MRTLRLQVPLMTGSDVSAWQHFLAAKNLYRDVVDGIYGPLSVQGTRDYQAAAGLSADGVAGIGTFSQALRDGFESPAGRVALPGMDACIDCGPFASSIASTGMKFVVRYYSKFETKSITRHEAVALSRADLQVAVVYEDSNNDISFFSTELGKENAAKAVLSAAEIGQPAGSAVYFAVDFDPSAGQVLGPISDYFRALSRAFSVAPTRYAVGIYGSGLTCRILRDAGLAAFTWLAGSTGFQESATFRPQAHLIQVSPERKICGGKLEIDDDIAQSENFGAFQILSS
jgi:peptidoglycan hydrolase-like protein with peptidoglycan-binding domain